ncbi:MAG: molybdopterin molybdenumtransferase MoeA [Mesorhizobium amorphae]|nr:MAG: molybdopterin molybdenumtransferase MoeA [Mesorhizobium amorphae]
MALLPVAEALERLLKDAGPVGVETVPLAEAAGRVLAAPLAALRTQPPFDASAMDGYAVRSEDIANVPARLRLTGMAQAGRRFGAPVGPGHAVRIFTGAPLPEGADTIAIQENVRTLSPDTIEVLEPAPPGKHIRRAGLDFLQGDTLLQAGRTLDSAALSLAASGNHPTVRVHARPLVAILATGDELVPPGSPLGPDQIVASNSFGIAAIAANAGARVLDLGIVADSGNAIEEKLRHAAEAGADAIVTVGGASVGDHDLVHGVLQRMGVDLAFWKIAMRPGKPLMFGRLGKARCIGLPGNPVASLICSHVFLRPLLGALTGRPFTPAFATALLGTDMAENDQRQDYVRARLERQGETLLAFPFAVQDSSMLRFFADADALIIRPPHAPALAAGSPCQVLLVG